MRCDGSSLSTPTMPASAASRSPAWKIAAREGGFSAHACRGSHSARDGEAGVPSMEKSFRRAGGAGNLRQAGRQVQPRHDKEKSPLASIGRIVLPPGALCERFPRIAPDA